MTMANLLSTVSITVTAYFSCEYNIIINPVFSDSIMTVATL